MYNSTPNYLSPNYQRRDQEIAPSPSFPRPPRPGELHEDDDDYIPSNKKEKKSDTYSNIYLKRINFRSELNKLILDTFKTEYNIDNSISNKVVERVLNNIYFEEQLVKSNSDIMTQSLKIEIDRLFASNIDIKILKKLVNKYF